MSVLVLIPDTDSARCFIAWGHQFAVTQGDPLRVLIPEEEEEVIAIAQEILQEVDPEAELLTVPCTESLRSILSLAREHDVNLILASIPQQKSDRSRIGAKLVENAPCDVILLRPAADSGEECKTILIPTAGGPHAKAALAFGNSLATDEDGVVTALYVAPPDIQEPQLSGETLLGRLLEKAGIEKSGHILPKVIVADNVMAGIGEAAKEGVDLILIGASNLGFMRRVLFGSIPEKLLKSNASTAVGIFRAKPRIWDQAQRTLDRILDKYVPQLTRESRIELYEGLNEGSQLGLDFITLISLSTAIASLGLMQNSGAVIIGAMLVAPLMTPMLGAGLGLVQGNLVLVRNATISILSGFFLSLVIGLFFGFCVPGFRDLTSELLARGSPNLLDLVIALLSGIAAAYATARPGLLGALPGVAIAAALVPPIATAGISLATGHTANGVGAAFLFGTNLVAIILSSALTLYVLGIRPNRQQEFSRIWSRRILVSLAVTALFFVFPLGASLVSNFTERPDPLRVAIETELKSMPSIRLGTLSFDHTGVGEILKVELYSTSPVATEIASRIAKTANASLESPHQIRVVTLLEWRSPKVASQ